MHWISHQLNHSSNCTLSFQRKLYTFRIVLYEFRAIAVCCCRNLVGTYERSFSIVQYERGWKRGKMLVEVLDLFSYPFWRNLFERTRERANILTYGRSLDLVSMIFNFRSGKLALYVRVYPSKLSNPFFFQDFSFRERYTIFCEFSHNL